MQHHGVHRPLRNISGPPHCFQIIKDTFYVFTFATKQNILGSAATARDYTLSYPYYSLKLDAYFQSSLHS